MPLNRPLLDALSDPTIAAMTDADVAVALSVPTYTPRTEAVTLTTLSGSSVWGFAKTAAFRAALQVASGNADQSIAAPASTLLSILEGAGFFATDPQVAAMVPTFVALGGGTITADDGQLAIGVRGYRFGAPIDAATVTAHRAALANYAAINALTNSVQSFYGSTMNEVLNPMLSDLISGKSVTVPASFDAMVAAWKGGA